MSSIQAQCLHVDRAWPALLSFSLCLSHSQTQSESLIPTSLHNGHRLLNLSPLLESVFSSKSLSAFRCCFEVFGPLIKNLQWSPYLKDKVQTLQLGIQGLPQSLPCTSFQINTSFSKPSGPARQTGSEWVMLCCTSGPLLRPFACNLLPHPSRYYPSFHIQLKYHGFCTSFLSTKDT